jgi:hypothetical protein
MRYLTIYLMLLYTGAAAQDIQYIKCTYSYFKNGKVSTSICYDRDNRNGEAIAYNKRGEKIYEQSIRRFAGNSSVNFSYYPSGAVQKAEWHNSADAGIQWYRKTTTFSEAGDVIDVNEQSNDDRPSVVGRPGSPEEKLQSPVVVKPIKKEAPACAAIYVTEFWYINNTRYTMQVSAKRIYSPYDSFSTTLKAGDTLKGGSFILAQMYDDPGKFYHFDVKQQGRANKKKYLLTSMPSLTKTVGTGLRRYYYKIG